MNLISISGIIFERFAYLKPTPKAYMLRISGSRQLVVVRVVHRHRTGVGSIPAGGPYS